MIAVAAFAAALLTQATAAPTPSAAPPVAAKPSPSDLICRSEPDPGSRLTHKVCLTRAQLRDRQLTNRQFVEDLSQQARVGPAIIMMGPPS